MNHLESSAKGWRLRRVGETIQTGDLQPAGVVWKPVDAWKVDTEVQGARYTDEMELILTPRKRRLSKQQVARKVWLVRVGQGLPVDGPLPSIRP